MDMVELRMTSSWEANKHQHEVKSFESIIHFIFQPFEGLIHWFKSAYSYLSLYGLLIFNSAGLDEFILLCILY